MKKLTKAMSVFALSAFLLFTHPVAAQTTDNTAGTTQTMDDDDDDDNGNWGLAGLLGLLGLLGLRRKDNDHRRTHDTTTNR